MEVRGTSSDPGAVRERMVRKPDRAIELYTETVEDEIAKWRAYAQSEAGQAALRLAQPMIQQADAILSMSMVDLVRMYGSVDVAREVMAEARGEKSVWVTLTKRPDALRAMLSEIEEKKKVKGVDRH